MTIDTQVVLPGLMGLGVIVSGLILGADAFRRLFPSRGLRRKSQVAHRIYAVTAAAARAAGRDLPAPELLRREPRARRTYWMLGAAGVALAVLFVRQGFVVFGDPGRLYANNWAIGLGIVVGLVPAIIAAFALTLAVAGPGRRSAKLAALVEETWLGRHRALPASRPDLIRSFMPEFEEEPAPR
jgi:hypothetical protein